MRIFLFEIPPLEYKNQWTYHKGLGKKN